MDEKSLNELLECSVCLERLDHNNKVLPCQHTFCKKCLQDIVASKQELHCPECRVLVNTPIDDLPTNIVLTRLLEGMNRQKRGLPCEKPGSSKRVKKEISTQTATDLLDRKPKRKFECARSAEQPSSSGVQLNNSSLPQQRPNERLNQIPMGQKKRIPLPRPAIENIRLNLSSISQKSKQVVHDNLQAAHQSSAQQPSQKTDQRKHAATIHDILESPDQKATAHTQYSDLDDLIERNTCNRIDTNERCIDVYRAYEQDLTKLLAQQEKEMMKIKNDLYESLTHDRKEVNTPAKGTSLSAYFVHQSNCQTQPNNHDQPLPSFSGYQNGIMGARKVSATQTSGAKGKGKIQISQAGQPEQSEDNSQGCSSLRDLLHRNPILWEGVMTLKNEQCNVKMHFISGNQSLVQYTFINLPKQGQDGGKQSLPIRQRMPIIPNQLNGVIKQLMQYKNYCIMLALPSEPDLENQIASMAQGFVQYLQHKQSAGIVTFKGSEPNQSDFIVYVFPPCEFSKKTLPSLGFDIPWGIQDIAHLVVILIYRQ